MANSLGDRKRHEATSKILLPRRPYVIIRIDGCHFHTYTKGFQKPFDETIIEDKQLYRIAKQNAYWKQGFKLRNDAMQTSTQYVCENAQGCKIGYVQSDEASFLLTDFDELTTDAWYDNQLQKLVSVAASMFTAVFNFRIEPKEGKFATFDTRAFVLPDRVEVMNYFLWRIKDAERNSLAGLCQANYSHKELLNKNASQQQEMLFQKGINWNDVDETLKRGVWLHKPFWKNELQVDGSKIPLSDAWEIEAAPRDKEEILKLIPTKE